MTSLHGDNGSLGFIEADQQWKWNIPLHQCPLAHKRNSIFFCEQHTLHVSGDQKNTT